MSDDLALTPEWWERWEGAYYWDPMELDTREGRVPTLLTRKGTAGLALANQEFGFTHEMITALRDLGHYNQSEEDSKLAHEAIDRLEALIRPERST